MNPKLKRLINPYKTRFFKFLTSSFKNSGNIAKLGTTERQNIRRILVTRPNHRLGNQLLLTPLIQSLEQEFPEAQIDLLVNGSLSRILFENYKCIDQIYALPKKPFKHLVEYLRVSVSIIKNSYDLAMVGIEDSNSSRIFVKLSRAKFKIFNAANNMTVSEHISKKPIDNLMSILEPAQTAVNYPKIDIKMSESEIRHGHRVLSEIINTDLKTIAIFTNATGNKKLSKKWWQALCADLEARLPNVNIFEILPKENTSQVDFKYPSWLSGDVREMAAVIENCDVFIGADSGVMHLATATSTPTFGLFNGQTNPKIYGPYGSDKYPIEIHKMSIKDLANKIEQTFKS
jgi:ADP-heptose:LPS heptosyltransferase